MLFRLPFGIQAILFLDQLFDASIMIDQLFIYR